MLVVERVSIRLAESGRKENQVSTESDQQFDPVKYKETTREQWQTAAEPWRRWGSTLEKWLGRATEVMLDMAEVAPGARVLDVAAGAGGQTTCSGGDRASSPASLRSGRAIIVLARSGFSFGPQSLFNTLLPQSTPGPTRVGGVGSPAVRRATRMVSKGFRESQSDLNCAG
jgi:hypothetical protein